MTRFPSYLDIPAQELGHGHAVRVRILGDAGSIARDMAQVMATCIRAARGTGRGATLIVPVGPVDQFPLLAELINAERLSCRESVFINMDEYLTDNDRPVSEDHPLSFRGYMRRKFYDLLDPVLAPPEEQRVFPNPRNPTAIQQLI
jgi:glucosamine-6-phosphate deaminase